MKPEHHKQKKGGVGLKSYDKKKFAFGNRDFDDFPNSGADYGYIKVITRRL